MHNILFFLSLIDHPQKILVPAYKNQFLGLDDKSKIAFTPKAFYWSEQNTGPPIVHWIQSCLSNWLYTSSSVLSARAKIIHSKCWNLINLFHWWKLWYLWGLVFIYQLFSTLESKNDKKTQGNFSFAISTFGLAEMMF